MNRMFLTLVFAAFLQTTPAWSQAAPGGSKVVDITPANVREQPFGFRVTTDVNMLGLPEEDTLRYTIEVTERDQLILPESEGSLYIFAGDEFVTCVNIAAVRKGKTFKYEFDIGRKYLGKKTSFTFVAVRAAIIHGVEKKLGDFYVFALPSFATK